MRGCLGFYNFPFQTVSDRVIVPAKDCFWSCSFALLIHKQSLVAGVLRDILTARLSTTPTPAMAHGSPSASALLQMVPTSPPEGFKVLMRHTDIQTRLCMVSLYELPWPYEGPLKEWDIESTSWDYHGPLWGAFFLPQSHIYSPSSLKSPLSSSPSSPHPQIFWKGEEKTIALREFGGKYIETDI